MSKPDSIDSDSPIELQSNCPVYPDDYPLYNESDEERWMAEVNPETCVSCGCGFDYKGGPQQCWRCKRK